MSPLHVVINLSCFMFLQTKDWSPHEAAEYISLSWDYDGRNVEHGEVIPVTLTLKVARDVLGIIDFNFNIIIFGTKYVLGDINQDGVVNIYDMVELVFAYGATPSNSHWNPLANLNGDNIINVYDATMLSLNYGASSPQFFCKHVRLKK